MLELDEKMKAKVPMKVPTKIRDQKREYKIYYFYLNDYYSKCWYEVKLTGSIRLFIFYEIVF